MMYKTVMTGSCRTNAEYDWMFGISDSHDRKINSLISCGWRPLGGVSYSESNGYAVLVQTMVKED